MQGVTAAISEQCTKGEWHLRQRRIAARHVPLRDAARAIAKQHLIACNPPSQAATAAPSVVARRRDYSSLDQHGALVVVVDAQPQRASGRVDLRGREVPSARHRGHIRLG